jgi:hypothetical protein
MPNAKNILYWESALILATFNFLIQIILKENFLMRFCYGNQFEVFCTLDHDDQTFVIAPGHESGRGGLSGRTRNYAFRTFFKLLPAANSDIFCKWLLFRVAANPALQFCHFVNTDCGYV